MKFGVIGYGKIARKFVKSIQYTDNGHIYAIASRTISPDNDYVKEHPNVILYHQYDELLTDPKVEAIYLALPHAMHKEWIIKALEHKIPVLCEKPAVLTSEDMKEVSNAVNQNQTYFLEALKTKFNVGFRQLQADLHDIGDITKIETCFCSDAYSKTAATSYLFEPGQGGALNDVGTYGIGFVLGLLGYDIEKIAAKVVKRNNIETSFQATLFYKNQVTACIEGAMDEKKERYAMISGKSGHIYIPMFNRIENYTIHLNRGDKLERSFPLTGDDMTLQIQEFIQDVTNRKLCSACHSLEDTSNIIEVMERIRDANQNYKHRLSFHQGKL